MFSAMSSNPDVGGFIHLANLYKRELCWLFCGGFDAPCKAHLEWRRGQGRSVGITRDASIMPPKRKVQDDNATPRRVTRRRQQPIADDEPDELNLASTKPPSTPGPRPGPRVVMDYIEIVTPRSFPLTPRGNVACASPTVNGLKLKALNVPSTPSRQPHPLPTSPAKTIPSTPSRARPPVTPRVSALKLHHQPNDVPVTPSKRSSPKKGGGLPSPAKLPGVLPAHLAPCLRLQKRAILGALQSSLSPEDIDNDDDLSTNRTAYTQLYNLLHGTTTRGEGNSCLLLGPRGSGKTSVSCHYTNGFF